MFGIAVISCVLVMCRAKVKHGHDEENVMKIKCMRVCIKQFEPCGRTTIRGKVCTNEYLETEKECNNRCMFGDYAKNL